MIHSFTPAGHRLAAMCSGVVDSIFTRQEYEQEHAEELVIVAAEAYENGGEWNTENRMWKEIHAAWMEIQANPPGAIQSWRVVHQYGQELPGLNTFRLRGSERMRYFTLVPKVEEALAKKQVISLLIVLASLWHTDQGWGIFHASGITRQGKAYLFLGRSGAGKSTAAKLSLQRGYSIIHDDHMLIHSVPGGRTLLATYGKPAEAMELCGLFCLHQSRENRLEALSPVTTTQRLLDSFFDFGVREALSGQYLQHAFGISANIARHVPGYELYFRKSPDFLDMIHDRTGNA